MVEAITIILAFVSLILIILSYIVGVKIGALRRDKWWEAEIPGHRKDAIVKSRAVLGGQFSEQLAPYMPDFPFSPTECRFMGKPVDFIVFNGMDEKKIDEVVFVEVKTANSKLSPQEKNLKETIETKRVRWAEYRIPEDVTGKNNSF